MRGSTSIVIVLVTIASTANSSSGEVPLVSKPSPCPCCADGACYPKRDTWGHYQGKWRRWPSDHRPDVPGREIEMPPGQLPEGLGPIEVPSKEEEDRRAPISAKEREERAVERGMQGAAETPPPFEPPAGAAAAPRGPAGPGGAPGLPPLGAPREGPLDFEFDPPPQLPFGQPPAGGLDGDEPADEFKFPYHGPGGQPQFDNDLPPALPRGLSRQTGSAAVADARFNNTGATSQSAVQRQPYVTARTSQSQRDSRVARASAQRSNLLDGRRVGRAVFLSPVTEVAR